jgi:hypothetical protein
MVRGSFASELGVDRFLPARLTGCVRHDLNDAMKQSAEPRSPPVHLDTDFAWRQRADPGGCVTVRGEPPQERTHDKG